MVSGGHRTRQDGYCTLHDRRRSYGSRWASKVPSQVLQGMMRHRNINITLEFNAEVKGAGRGGGAGCSLASLKKW